MLDPQKCDMNLYDCVRYHGDLHSALRFAKRMSMQFTLRGQLSIRHSEADHILLDDKIDLSYLIQDRAQKLAASKSDDHGYPRSYYGRYVITFEKVSDD